MLNEQEDVLSECNNHGAVVFCKVETKKLGGFVYVKFENVDAAVKTASALHNRFYGGRVINVSYLTSVEFEQVIC